MRLLAKISIQKDKLSASLKVINSLPPSLSLALSHALSLARAPLIAGWRGQDLLCGPLSAQVSVFLPLAGSRVCTFEAAEGWFGGERGFSSLAALQVSAALISAAVHEVAALRSQEVGSKAAEVIC